MPLPDWLLGWWADAVFWIRSFWEKPVPFVPTITPFRITMLREYFPTHTYSVLTCGDLTFQILEHPDRGNTHGNSCIPENIYLLKPHDWNKHPGITVMELLQLDGSDILGADGKPRKPIDLHTGNTLKDSLGCPMIGTHRAVINGQPGITESKAAFTTFMGFMSAHPDAEIEIRKA